MTIELINYGTINKNKVCIGDLALFFSYSTIVAFHSEKTGLVCCENCWSNTTGKFLNEIEPRKERRVGKEVFDEKLKVAIYYGLIKKIIENLALSGNAEVRRHSSGLIKAIEKESFVIKAKEKDVKCERCESMVLKK